MRPFEPVEVGPEYTADALRLLGFGGWKAPGLPDDPFLPKQWHWMNDGQPDDQGQTGSAGADIGLFPAWDAFHPQAGTVLAIVDSGLDLQHEDVDPSLLWTNPGESGVDAQGRDKGSNGVDDDGNGYVDDLHGWNFVRNTPGIQEDQYHGTHVGGLLFARTGNGAGTVGMARGIRIMLVKVFGLGATLDSTQFARAIRYAVDNGARVLSNSYGTPSYTSAMHEAVKYAAAHGALFVCASGNSRKNMDDPEERDYPSCYGVENQLVVGAVSNRDRSTFSNFGSMVEIAGPGESIFSLFPKNTYRSLSGTSQACPIVACAAAMLWSQHPGWSFLEVKRELLRTADQVEGLGRYIRDGLRLNLLNALAGKPGRRLPVENFADWREEERVVESSHPYYSDRIATFAIEIPGARKMRLHFSRIAVDHYGDEIRIDDAEGRMVEQINGLFGEHWSAVIPGNRAAISLIANQSLSDYGFRIDRVQWR